jgi:PAS domain S-box-containing protein
MSEITKKSDQQKVAEAEVESFRKDLGPFVVAAETTRMAMVFTDATKPDNPIIFANDSFLSLTGYDREEVLGKSFNFLMAHGDDAEVLTQIKAEFEGSSSSGTEVRYCRKDGGEFWASVFISPAPPQRPPIAPVLDVCGSDGSGISVSSAASVTAACGSGRDRS